MTSLFITAHAIERAAMRWGVQEPAVAEWMIHECIRLGDIVPRDNGSIHFRHVLPGGFTRIAIVKGMNVVTVANHRSKTYLGARRRKLERRNRL